MNQERAGLSIKNLSIAKGDTTLVCDWSLHIQAGETVALMGASGSGKSTLLSWLCGLLDPAFRASGELWLDQHRIDQHPCEKRRMGLLFQDALLFPHLSVGENLLFGVSANTAKAQRRPLAEAALQEAGLEGYFDRDPHTLSGGQRARVSLMRTLLAQPQALLLDEPFARLDQHLRMQFREFLLQHSRERKLPVLIVTHDPEDVPSDSLCLSMTHLARPR